MSELEAGRKYIDLYLGEVTLLSATRDRGGYVVVVDSKNDFFFVYPDSLSPLPERHVVELRVPKRGEVALIDGVPTSIMYEPAGDHVRYWVIVDGDTP